MLAFRSGEEWWVKEFLDRTTQQTAIKIAEVRRNKTERRRKQRNIRPPLIVAHQFCLLKAHEST